jgi:hypothetical protein
VIQNPKKPQERKPKDPLLERGMSTEPQETPDEEESEESGTGTGEEETEDYGVVQAIHGQYQHPHIQPYPYVGGGVAMREHPWLHLHSPALAPALGSVNGINGARPPRHPPPDVSEQHVEGEDDEWIDDESDSDGEGDLLGLEHHPNYVRDSARRRIKFEKGWENLVSAVSVIASNLDHWY